MERFSGFSQIFSEESIRGLAENFPRVQIFWTKTKENVLDTPMAMLTEKICQRNSNHSPYIFSCIFERFTFSQVLSDRLVVTVEGVGLQDPRGQGVGL